MRLAPPNSEVRIPDEWPTYGEYLGRRIDLREDAPRMAPDELADVYVDVRGVGRIRPWKGSDYAIADNGDIAP